MIYTKFHSNLLKLFLLYCNKIHKRVLSENSTSKFIASLFASVKTTSMTPVLENLPRAFFFFFWNCATQVGFAVILLKVNQ